jgi:hypothetical protein
MMQDRILRDVIQVGYSCQHIRHQANELILAGFSMCEQRKYGSSKLHWCLISVWWVVQFSKALNRFQKEDPTFRVSLDPDSGQVSACYFLRLLPPMQNT